MRVCSLCGETNEDWMEICQRCGNSIINSVEINDYQKPKESYKTKKSNTNYSYNQVNKSEEKTVYSNNKKGSSIMDNLDLKIILIMLLIVFVVLLGYTLFTII